MFKYREELKRIIKSIIEEEDVKDSDIELEPEKPAKEDVTITDSSEPDPEDVELEPEQPAEADVAIPEPQEAQIEQPKPVESTVAAPAPEPEQKRAPLEDQEVDIEIEDETPEPEPTTEPAPEAEPTPEPKPEPTPEVEVPDNETINYTSLQDYQKIATTKGIRSAIVPGYYYTFDYFFDKDNDDYDEEELKYWDTKPLVLIYDQNVTKDGKKTFFGFNFHMLPIEERERILGPATTSDDRTIQKSGANWETAGKGNKKLGFAVRQYRSDRIRNIYKVGPNGFRELCKFKAPTYYRSTYTQITQKFNEEV
jgi:hypothetical protein